VGEAGCAEDHFEDGVAGLLGETAEEGGLGLGVHVCAVEIRSVVFDCFLGFFLALGEVEVR